ncbi:MAG: hypothetical protein LBE09_02285 [Christensenellaceae bacterium]|nr:hypothetical protein [Christensenellaceae bacterium]
MMKKLLTVLLLIIFMCFALSACVAPWAAKIAEMKTTWQSEIPFMQFMVSGNENMRGIGFGLVVDSNGGGKDICFFWSCITVEFFVYLTNGETDYEKIIASDDNVVLYGTYSYPNKIRKQVKLTIKNELYSDRLFNGLYDSIILTYL